MGNRLSIDLNLCFFFFCCAYSIKEISSPYRHRSKLSMFYLMQFIRKTTVLRDV
jgi:hypothetical protein